MYGVRRRKISSTIFSFFPLALAIRACVYARTRRAFFLFHPFAFAFVRVYIRTHTHTNTHTHIRPHTETRSQLSYCTAEYMTIVTMMMMMRKKWRSIINRSKQREHPIEISFVFLFSFFLVSSLGSISSRTMTINKTHATKDNSCTSLHKYTHQSSFQSIHFLFFFHVIRRQERG